MQEIKIHAPVIIPTLNRYVHFKRCLESLERCTGAEQTDVYVGLDYPPSEKYVEGWNLIDAYLAEKEKKNKFKKLIVFRRDHNCGVGKEGSNSRLLLAEVKLLYDRYIFSEDDNEFSPNFLEYMNKALEMYKDIPHVIKISAYTPTIFGQITDKTTFFGIDTPAYGLGSWFKKDKEIKTFDYLEIEKELKSSLKAMWHLFWCYPALIYMAAHMVKSKKNYGDIRFSMHNLLYGTFSLQPTQSLVRNWGADGSGLHSGVVKGLEKEEIQTSPHFEIQDIPFEYPSGLKKRLKYRNMPQNKVKYFLYIVYKFLYVVKFYLFG